MRWERLFQDLEDQLERESDAEREDLERDEERARLAKMSMADRLRDMAGESTSAHPVRLAIPSCEVECSVLRVGRDWALVEINSPSARRGTAIVPIPVIRSVAEVRAVSDVRYSSRNVSQPVTSSSLAANIGLTFVLRDLSRRRREVMVLSDGLELTGTIERVGSDHFDIALTLGGASRSLGQSRKGRTIASGHVELIVLT